MCTTTLLLSTTESTDRVLLYIDSQPIKGGCVEKGKAPLIDIQSVIDHIGNLRLQVHTKRCTLEVPSSFQTSHNLNA